MSCISCCGKTLLIIVNLLFVISGLAFTILGIVVLVGAAFLQSYLEALLEEIPNITGSLDLETTTSSSIDGSVDLEVFNGIGIALLVLGIFILIVGSLGMCGACCLVRCMLISYVVIVLIIFLGQLIFLILLVCGVFVEPLQSSLTNSIENQYGGIDDFSPTSLAWNFVMLNYECCGLYNYTDFANAEKWNRERDFSYNDVSVQRTLVTPVACCAMTGTFPSLTPIDDNCTFYPTDLNNNWNKGCWEEVNSQVVDANRSLIIGIYCGVLLFELLVCVVAICLLIHDQDEDKVGIV